MTVQEIDGLADEIERSPYMATSNRFISKEQKARIVAALKAQPSEAAGEPAAVNAPHPPRMAAQGESEPNRETARPAGSPATSPPVDALAMAPADPAPASAEGWLRLQVSISAIKKWQRHWLLRQYGDDGHVLKRNLDLSEHIDRVLAASPLGQEWRDMRECLASIINWWEGLPNDLRQDVEGSGAEPGCIVRARRLWYAPRPAGAALTSAREPGGVK